MKRAAASLDEVIQRAIELISSDGVSSLTIRGLSEATGVSVGTLYNYFGDKTGLIFQVMDAFWESTLNGDVVQAIAKPLALPDMLAEIYAILRERSCLFHHDFISDVRMVGSLPEGHACTRANYLMVVQQRLRDMVHRFPEFAARVQEEGVEDEFVQFIMDNFMALLSRNAPDVGLLRGVVGAYVASMTSEAQAHAVHREK